MPRVPPLDRPATYDDLVALPDIYIAEIVNGELHASRRLPPRASGASSAVGWRIAEAYDERPRGPEGCWVLRAVEVHLGADVLVPDWAVWRRSRVPTLRDLDWMPTAPEWVLEVLTPETVALDRCKKLAIYAREGVAHAWLLDPVAQTLEVLRLENGRWSILGVHCDDEIVRAEPFDAIDLDLAALWAD